MPGRKEFEYEYENDADQIIKDIEFTPDDSKEDIGNFKIEKINNALALKCAVLNNYNIILERRAYRKSFLFERGLTEFKKVFFRNSRSLINYQNIDPVHREKETER